MLVKTPTALEVVSDLIKANPSMSKQKIFDLFVADVFRNPIFQREICWYFFANSYGSIVEKPRTTIDRARAETSRSQSREHVTKIKKKIHLLALTMPNGKAMHDCTGFEMSTFGTRFIGLAQRVGFENTVGSALTEDEVRELLNEVV